MTSSGTPDFAPTRDTMEAPRSLSRRFWGPAPPGPSPTPARPFWVSPGGGEGRPRGVLAASLGELREQAGSALGLPPPLSLALAEDGTLAPPSWELGGARGRVPEGPPEVARLSLLVAQGDPRGRLRLAAQIRGVRWDLGALGPERMFRELLRLLAALTRTLGHALLGVAGALRPLLEGPPSPQGGH
ncbi:lipid transferase CIDEB-like [Chamaea fasciata]|uniref:lipid transferase CIDEB-like n=1 Tax=Chamaea fasciata TaxID=190680 RepID=UPI003369C6D2